MQGVTESLAGRVAILDLLGLSHAEIQGHAERSQPFLPSPDWIQASSRRPTQPRVLMDLYRAIWRGGFPRPALDESLPRDIFFSAILKSDWHNGGTVTLHFYRDRDGNEIDLITEHDNRLYPIEIKKTATPSRNASRHFDTLSRLGRPIGPGTVLCLKEEPVPLSAEVTAMPIWDL